MDHLFTSSRKLSLSSNRVLRNTYFLLSLTLAFSAVIAAISMIMNVSPPGFILTLIGFYGLMFLTYKFSNSIGGIFATFAFTGFMGYTLGPILNLILVTDGSQTIILALSGTTLVFVCCSVYMLTTNRDMSFLSGMLMSGSIVLLIAIIANIFLKINALSLTISAMFILFSSGAILLETHNIISRGETNYIRATISLYVSLYNIFVSLLNIISNVKNSN